MSLGESMKNLGKTWQEPAIARLEQRMQRLEQCRLHVHRSVNKRFLFRSSVKFFDIAYFCAHRS